ncbi:MAG: hypothetical protein WBM86_24445 [Waterburya sp.]
MITTNGYQVFLLNRVTQKYAIAIKLEIHNTIAGNLTAFNLPYFLVFLSLLKHLASSASSDKCSVLSYRENWM